jgi:hypothetical protein
MAKLGGALIGYGIKKRNGEEKKVIFDKPIHNTITKSCLNNLLTFDGTNAQPSTSNDIGNYLSLFVKSTQSSERYGVFNSAALGDGTGETSVNDTELKHRVTDATSTKKAGNGWCGTVIDNENAIIKLRISHTHTINENFVVKEIGWYNQKWQELVYSLSARVQLDEGIQVESGDEFYSIYELTIQFQGVERFSDFAGLGVGGYKVNAGIQEYGANYYFPTIDNNGNPIGCGDYFDPQWSPVIWPAYMYYKKISTYYAAGKSGIVFGTNDKNKLKPFTINSDYGFFNTFSERGAVVSAVEETFTIKDYVSDSFFRDFETLFTFPQSSNQYYGFLCNGTFYRFGTFDEQGNFTPTPITINGALKITSRQSWSTDLLTPAG